MASIGSLGRHFSCFKLIRWLAYGVGYILLGLCVGVLSTIVGVGGGILLVPIFMYLHPELPISGVTAASLFCVCLSSFSGSIQYALRKLINFKLAMILTVSSLPGVWIGLKLNQSVGRQGFEIYYAIFLLGLAIFLFKKNKKSNQSRHTVNSELNVKQSLFASVGSFLIGIFSSFFGVGGGILYVPYLNHGLKLPVHFSTGTTQLVMALSTLVAVGYHFFSGQLGPSQNFVLFTALGLVTGAQIGGYYAQKIRAELIMRALAIVVLLMALRTLYRLF